MATHWFGLINTLALLTMTEAAIAEDLTLTTDGQTVYIIVTAVKPTVEEQTAAQWLFETLEQVTGAKFPIKQDGASDLPQTMIRVAADAKMKPEEWRIQTVGESLLLTGGLPRGVIYAVCEFLEVHVGVERLDPFTEFVPKQTTLKIPALDRRGQPAFPYRYVFTGWPYQNSAPQGENGVNGSRWRIWNKEQIYAGPVNGDYNFTLAPPKTIRPEPSRREASRRTSMLTPRPE